MLAANREKRPGHASAPPRRTKSAPAPAAPWVTQAPKCAEELIQVHIETAPSLTRYPLPGEQCISVPDAARARDSGFSGGILESIDPGLLESPRPALKSRRGRIGIGVLENEHAGKRFA